MHHARNPQYIDRNYGGVFIIWDRMFGTFVPEVEPCDHGIVRQMYSRKPLVMVFHEWIDLLRDMSRRGGLGDRLRHVWAPPEWQRPRQDRPALPPPLPIPPPFALLVSAAAHDDIEDWPVHAGW